MVLPVKEQVWEETEQDMEHLAPMGTLLDWESEELEVELEGQLTTEFREQVQVLEESELELVLQLCLRAINRIPSQQWLPKLSSPRRLARHQK